MHADPSAEVIALSPKSLMATNRFVCEICKKGFQRDQNLQLHRRGHNLPWKLKQRSSTEVMRKRVYVCPEPSCVHHNPARALGDLTGIKKHYSRKHGEKKWKCEKCSKKYAVQSDWKAHSKTCGTKEYKCDCGTIFSRRDSFITHRAFCDALAEENTKQNPSSVAPDQVSLNNITAPKFMHPSDTKNQSNSLPHGLMPMAGTMLLNTPASLFGSPTTRNLPSSSSLQLGAIPSAAGFGANSATALLQKAAQMGACATGSSSSMNSPMMQNSLVTSMAPPSFSGAVAQQHSSNLYDQPQLAAGIMGGGFTSQFMQSGLQETSVSHFFNANNGVDDNSGINDMELYSRLLNPNHEFLMKSTVNNNNANSHSSVLHGKDPNLGSSAPNFGGNGNNETMTVDFLGVGGMRPRDFHGQHQQEMEFEAISQQRMQGLSPFQ
ncbi:hypothetical protein RJ640_024769 [Escallonia rubra]|uniref:C2H2-type domain-containing protein n=1 Tax=Escallonia rubra TaxID=112253 RepID=A0AA88QTH6_9ASTE|nr:hypothetical protein RJ640_024769 [Escallonia rubra]